MGNWWGGGLAPNLGSEWIGAARKRIGEGLRRVGSVVVWCGADFGVLEHNLFFSKKSEATKTIFIVQIVIHCHHRSLTDSFNVHTDSTFRSTLSGPYFMHSSTTRKYCNNSRRALVLFIICLLDPLLQYPFVVPFFFHF